jgi:hypothetical protein
MLDPWISNLTLKVVAALSLIVPIYVALRLGLRHRREQADKAENDNRTRSLFHPGVPDREGDRTAELLQEFQTGFMKKETDASQVPGAPS